MGVVTIQPLRAADDVVAGRQAAPRPLVTPPAPAGPIAAPPFGLPATPAMPASPDDDPTAVAQHILIARVRRLRLVLPPLIFVVVVAHQAWLALVQVPQSPLHQLLAGVLVYGLIAPLVTHRTLDWIAHAAEAQTEVKARVRQGERALASITNSSADAILSLDTDGIVQSWNRGATEILGFPADRIIGRSVDAVLPPLLQPHGALALIRQRLESHGYVRGGQVRCRRMDGGTVPVDMTQTVLRDEQGRVVGSSVILRDMTARVAAERAVLAVNRQLEERVAERTRQLEASGEQLRMQNDQLEAANAELSRLDALKDEFVALVSHELRAPLTNIQASVELLQMRDRRPGRSGADLQAHDDARDEIDRLDKLEIIGQEVERLGRLVRGVLDVSRMQTGGFQLRTAPVEPGELCAAALARVDLGARAVSLAIAPGLPPVLADFDRAVQVLVNLLENAAKYSPEATPIDVDVVRGGAVEAGAIVFAVTDRGIGIPADEQGRIFDRFHRVARGDDRTTYGHGLGLHIARGLVDAHGGRLWVESVAGQGSTFAFTLPVASEDGP